MKLKITPEIRKSMEATQAELDVAMRDPSFRAEHEQMVLKYDIQEAIAKLFTKAAYAKRLASFSKQQYVYNLRQMDGQCITENVVIDTLRLNAIQS